jgi:hypothetical protein
METKKRARTPVTFVFPLTDQQRLMVHLEDWEWPYARFGPVHLRVGRHRIRMLHEGSTNLHGTPAVRLAPSDRRYKGIDQIMQVVSEHDLSDISLEFEMQPESLPGSRRHRRA